MVRGSVNSIGDVEEAVKAAPAPIKGVFHFAMAQRVSRRCPIGKPHSSHQTNKKIGLPIPGYDMDGLA
jgi:hypothetical protein